MPFYRTLFASHTISELVKDPSANAGEARDMGSIPVLGQSPGVGKRSLVGYSPSGHKELDYV